LLLISVLAGLCLSVAAPAQNSYNVIIPNNIFSGTQVSISVSVVDKTQKPVANYTGQATIAVSGVAISYPLPVVSTWPASAATITVPIIFTGTGIATITVTDTAAAISPFSTTTTISSMQSICAECYASIGIGTAMTPVAASDYSNSSNILSSNQVGSSTPQYLVGVSFQIPIRGVRYTPLGCQMSDYAAAHPKSTYCYPWKAFVNLNLSTTTSQTLSGYTFGLSHSLTSHLDLMAGFVYGAYSQPSPGFQAAATQTVKTQQAASNPYYAQFNLAAMQSNSKNAFDGFPTQLISSTGVAGTAIYSGNILTTAYHPGIFFGINIPISLGSLFSGTNGGK
jgi:hypothetical protein